MDVKILTISIISSFFVESNSSILSFFELQPQIGVETQKEYRDIIPICGKCKCPILTHTR
jgi:hypothetical protein